MNITVLKYTAILLLTGALLTSCNSKTDTQGSIESDIKNPPTSQDSVTSYRSSESTGDSASSKRADASRMSDGKDSVSGEVTPPNAQKQ